MDRILVVDDDRELRGWMRELLTRAGYQVSEAADGNEALKQLREARLDLVILDLVMPEKDGVETLLELRREFPGLKVIAISGRDYLAIAEHLGAQETLAKPFTASELISAVQAVLAD